MNPRTMRARHTWQMYMWRQKRHWALVSPEVPDPSRCQVLQPMGEVFTVRLVDDFVRPLPTSLKDAFQVHNAERCFNAEVLSQVTWSAVHGRCPQASFSWSMSPSLSDLP